MIILERVLSFLLTTDSVKNRPIHFSSQAFKLDHEGGAYTGMNHSVGGVDGELDLKFTTLFRTNICHLGAQCVELRL